MLFSVVDDNYPGSGMGGSGRFPELLGPTERELLLKVTNFPDSLSSLISHLPERESVSLSMRVPSLWPNVILEVE